MGGLALVCFRKFFLVVGGFGWLWAALGDFSVGLLVILANIRWLREVVGYFDNSVQCWRFLGDYGCL